MGDQRGEEVLWGGLSTAVYEMDEWMDRDEEMTVQHEQGIETGRKGTTREETRPIEEVGVGGLGGWVE